MTFEEVFNIVVKNLLTKLFEYIDNAISIAELIEASELFTNYLQAYDKINWLD